MSLTRVLRKLPSQFPQFVHISGLTKTGRTPPRGRDTLAEALATHMQILGVSEIGKFLWITGVIKVQVDSRLSCQDLTVPVRLMFCDFWVDIAPVIWIAENLPWVRTGGDWHVYLDRSVCYELEKRWTEHLTELGLKGESDLPDLASQWIINGVCQVLHVQFTCHKLGIQTWPEDVAPSWPHGKPALDLYEQEKTFYRTTRK